jgi:protein pelota
MIVTNVNAELNQLTGIAAILTFPLDIEVVEAEEREEREEKEARQRKEAEGELDGE